MENEVKFERKSFGKRVKSILKVDFKRMFKSKLFYILLACALVVPIIMMVMLTMMDGSVSVNPQTGVETIIHGPENAWQSIGTLPGAESAGGMDVLSMCNINMMFMGVAVFICLFISEDFRSGYAKNLFTVRSKKGDYVISKTLAGFVCGTIMLILYFVGAMLGGAISGLSFDLGSLTAENIVMCMLAKIFLMFVFISIFVLISVAAKQKAWLAIMRFLLVRYINKNKLGEKRLMELERSRLCAIILTTLNLVLSGAVLMILYRNRGFHYNGILIYVMAMYTFYVTTTAIIDLIQYRKYDNPILSTSKVIKMAAALVSMLSLETAMFSQFGEEMSPENQRIMIALTGAGVSVVVITMAIYIIVRSTKEIKQVRRLKKNGE